MTEKKITKDIASLEILEPEFEGVYGKYKITMADKLEVRRYRIAVLICGASFVSGIGQWLIIGPGNAWIWLIPMSISLGLALKWIHIYIKAIHLTLQTLWALGSIGIVILIFTGDPNQLLSTLTLNKFEVLAIGPFFAALTGLGFKEFFCFRQPEAIGVTLFLPITLLGHSLGALKPSISMFLLSLSSLLLLILGFRKFGMDPASDIGDKSVFEYLKNMQSTNTSSI